MTTPKLPLREDGSIDCSQMDILPAEVSGVIVVNDNYIELGEFIKMLTAHVQEWCAQEVEAQPEHGSAKLQRTLDAAAIRKMRV